jgi:hypothetical protein
MNPNLVETYDDLVQYVNETYQPCSGELAVDHRRLVGVLGTRRIHGCASWIVKDLETNEILIAYSDGGDISIREPVFSTTDEAIQFIIDETKIRWKISD